jgi:hypothetical protein
MEIIISGALLPTLSKAISGVLKSIINRRGVGILKILKFFKIKN